MRGYQEIDQETKDWHEYMSNYFGARIPTKTEMHFAKREYKQKQSNMSTLNTPKLSKVKSVTGAGDFTNEYGSFKTWEYTMEDGTVLQANHKATGSPFNVGDEIEYVIKRQHPEYGNSGKVTKPQENTSPAGNSSAPNLGTRTNDTNKSIQMQVCLKEANAFHAQHGFKGDETQTEVTATAKIFYDELFG